MLPTLFTACGSDNNNDPADDISGLTVNTDLKNNEVSAKGGSFFLQIKTDGKWYNRQIKKFPTEKQNVSLKHILT